MYDKYGRMPQFYVHLFMLSNRSNDDKWQRLFFKNGRKLKSLKSGHCLDFSAYLNFSVLHHEIQFICALFYAHLLMSKRSIGSRVMEADLNEAIPAIP